MVQMTPPKNGTVTANANGSGKSRNTPWFSGDRKEMMICFFIVISLVITFIGTHLGIQFYKKMKWNMRIWSQNITRYKVNRLRRKEERRKAKEPREPDQDIELAAIDNGSKAMDLSFKATDPPNPAAAAASDTLQVSPNTTVIIPPRPFSRASSYRTEGILPSNQEHSVPNTLDAVESRPSSPVQEISRYRPLSRASSAHSIRELNTRYATLNKVNTVPEDGNTESSETDQRAETPLPQRVMSPDLLRVATGYRSTSPGPSNLHHLRSLRRNVSQESLRRYRTERYMRQMSLTSTLSITSRPESIISVSSSSTSTSSGSDTIVSSSLSSMTLLGSDDGEDE